MTYTADVPPAHTAQVIPLRAIEVRDRKTNERLAVELEIGQQLWLRAGDGRIEVATRDQLPDERYEVIETVDIGCWGGDKVRGAA